MRVNEARSAQGQSITTILGSALETMGVSVPIDSFNGVVDDILDTFTAYGDARELKGHVDACVRYELVKEPGLVYTNRDAPCGSDWYCDNAPTRAKELEELGR